jgi:putative sigma-54 modulation protein
MHIQITARHFKASEELRAHVTQRCNRLTQFYDGITDVRVILGIDQARQEQRLAEIAVLVYRQTLTAHDLGSTHEEAVDRCVDHLRKQVLKYKAKLRSKGRRQVPFREEEEGAELEVN